MNANRIENIVVRVIEKQNISSDDVRDFCHAVEEGGFISQAEAEALIRADRMAPASCEAWGEFFVDTLVAHLVWERRPTGQIRAEDVTWLVSQLEQPRLTGGHVGPLLVALVRDAEHVDERLLTLALAENRVPGAPTTPLAGMVMSL